MADSPAGAVRPRCVAHRRHGGRARGRGTRRRRLARRRDVGARRDAPDRGGGVAVFEDLGVQHDRDGEAVGLPAARRHPVREVRATFFNFDFPKNVFQLRRPFVDPPTGPLPEPEIHARLVDALGFLDGDAIEQLRAAATRDRDDFAAAFAQAMTSDPKLATVAPVVLYRTLGETLPHGAAAAAALWPMAIRCSHRNPEGVARAGFGSGPDAGNHATAAATRAADVLGFTARI